jgi:hypothetical protein
MPRYRESMAGFEAGHMSLGWRFGAEGEIPEQLEWLARKDDRESKRLKGPADEPAWKRTAELQLDQLLSRLGDEDSPERRGTLDALTRARSILERSKS